MEDSDLQSGAVIGSNDDLLTEILIRLPVISILRFKSVSKRWRLLLSHRHFTHRYDNNFSKSVGLFNGDIYVPFDVENRSPHPFRSHDFYFNRSNVRIKHSCNGLLLCYALHKRAYEYYVFNPTTKQLAVIPSIPSRPKNIRSMALAFHHTDCVHYKVVCVRSLDTSAGLFQIQVYSSHTGKWKICIESFSAHTSEFCHPVYWNGAVHWVPDFPSGENFLYFKLEVEQLQMLPVPEEMVSDDDELFTMYFGESRGHLHLISHSKFEDRILNLNVYEMLKDYSGWLVKYRVKFDELPGFPEMVEFYSGVIDVVRGKEEETFLVLVTTAKLMRYNVHDKSFNPIYSQTKDDFYEETSHCHRYIEALSSF